MVKGSSRVWDDALIIAQDARTPPRGRRNCVKLARILLFLLSFRSKVYLQTWKSLGTWRVDMQDETVRTGRKALGCFCGQRFEFAKDVALHIRYRNGLGESGQHKAPWGDGMANGPESRS